MIIKFRQCSSLLNPFISEYEYEAPLEKWAAILRLAHMWQFQKIKALATRKLDKLDIEPIDKAVMALQYEVDPDFGWLEQAYTAIGEREEPISKAEAERLGLDVVVHLAELRERIRKTRFEQEKIELQQMSIATHVPSPTTNPSGSLSQLDQHDAETTSSQNLSLTECRSNIPPGITLEQEMVPEDATTFKCGQGDPPTSSSATPLSSDPPSVKKGKGKKVEKMEKGKKVKKVEKGTLEKPVVFSEDKVKEDTENYDLEAELAELLGEELKGKKGKKGKKGTSEKPVVFSVNMEEENTEEVDLEAELAELIRGY